MLAVWGELRHFPRIGRLRRAFTFSTWTLTSHIAYAMGRLPWEDSRRSAGGQKRRLSDFRRWNVRLGVRGGSPFADTCDFQTAVRSLGYSVQAVVSANPIGPETPFRHFADSVVSVGKEGDCLLRICKLVPEDGLGFVMLNTCETHYPYYDGSYDDELTGSRYIAGYRGQVRAAARGVSVSLPSFSRAVRERLFLRQCSAIKYVDSKLEALLRKLPKGAFLTVTADHGDCFGEGGFVGHGEVADVKVLEVPLIEGRV